MYIDKTIHSEYLTPSQSIQSKHQDKRVLLMTKESVEKLLFLEEELVLAIMKMAVAAETRGT